MLSMKTFIRVMKALSDPSRVRIVKTLLQRPLCVCELTALLGLGQPTVSKHLRLLEDAGLVESERDGAWVNYRIAAKPDNPYAAAMLRHLGQWLEDDASVVAMKAAAATVDRNDLKRLPAA